MNISEIHSLDLSLHKHIKALLDSNGLVVRCKRIRIELVRLNFWGKENLPVLSICLYELNLELNI